MTNLIHGVGMPYYANPGYGFLDYTNDARVNFSGSSIPIGETRAKKQNDAVKVGVGILAVGAGLYYLIKKGRIKPLADAIGKGGSKAAGKAGSKATGMSAKTIKTVLKGADNKELQKIARKYNIKFVGVKKETLINQLSKEIRKEGLNVKLTKGGKIRFPKQIASVRPKVVKLNSLDRQGLIDWIKAHGGNPGFLKTQESLLAQAKEIQKAEKDAAKKILEKMSAGKYNTPSTLKRAINKAGLQIKTPRNGLSDAAQIKNMRKQLNDIAGITKKSGSKAKVKSPVTPPPAAPSGAPTKRASGKPKKAPAKSAPKNPPKKATRKTPTTTAAKVGNAYLDKPVSSDVWRMNLADI